MFIVYTIFCLTFCLQASAWSWFSDIPSGCGLTNLASECSTPDHYWERLTEATKIKCRGCLHFNNGKLFILHFLNFIQLLIKKMLYFSKDNIGNIFVVINANSGYCTTDAELDACEGARAKVCEYDYCYGYYYNTSRLRYLEDVSCGGGYRILILR